MIDRLTYFWGLFDSPENASAEAAVKRVCFDTSPAPPEVLRSFEAERISELEGEFGLPGVGEPTEVDCLEYTVDGSTRAIRVLNRGISLFQGETPELVCLHWFFSVLQRDEVRSDG